MRAALTKAEGDNSASVQVEAFLALVPVAVLAIAGNIPAEIVLGEELFGVVKDLALDEKLW